MNKPLGAGLSVIGPGQSAKLAICRIALGIYCLQLEEFRYSNNERGYSDDSRMRHLKFLPLAFLAGQHGFALLAPYMAFCMTLHALLVQRRLRPAAIAIQG